MRTCTSMVVLAAALACLAACGDGNDSYTTRPARGVLEGVYDATVQIGDDPAFESVGTVFAGAEGASIVVQLGNDASVSLSGRVSSTGELSGDGFLFVTDIGFQSTGTAVFAEVDGVATITGSAIAPNAFSGFGRPIAFTLRRPADADASGFSGTYRFTLSPSPSSCSCTSTIDLAFAFDAAGFGVASATTERDGAGTVIASLTGAGVSLSPLGRVRVSFQYPAPNTISFTSSVALIGELTSAGGLVTGSGDTFAGFTPANRIGSWTAERIE